MSTCFAEPSTLCAYCAADPGGDFLAKGTHLRVLPSRMLGLPLMPFVAMPVNVLDIREKLFVWGDDPVPEMGADLDAAGGEVTGYLPKPLSGGRRVIGVEVVFVSGGSGSVAVIDTTDDRVITRRSTAPYRVGAPCIERVRVRGRGIFTLIAYVVQPEELAHALLGTRAYPQRFGLPLEGRYPWYVAGEGEAAAWERVAGGGPLTLTRADLPDGPFPELSDPLAVERSRVLAFSGELTTDAKLLVGDERVPPSHVVAVTTIPARVVGTARQPWQRLVSNIRDNLLMKSLDPGAGRYLGLMAWFNELPGNARSAWLTAGVFVCRTGADPDARRDALPLTPPDPLEGSLLRHFIDLYPELDDIARRAAEGQREGWWLGVCDGKRDAYCLQLRVFATAALAVPTPDAPDAPDVSPGHAEWIAEASVASTRFRQSFLVRSAPLSCLVAMGRLQDQWVTRHEIQSLDSGANPAVRAAPMFLGSRNALSDGASSLISDSDISVVGVPWRYRFALGDVFGRFGGAADCLVASPARPPIPAPVLHAMPHWSAPAPHRDPVSAGSVTFHVAVPRITDLAAGTLPLAMIHMTFAGQSKSVPAPQDRSGVDVDFTLPDLMPMETRRLQAVAHFEDDEGNKGLKGVLPLDIVDPRAPLAVEAGVGIVWTSRPGPSDEVEFRLAFRGEPNVAYRAYLSDARGLGIPLVSGGRARMRAEIAVDGARRSNLGMRDRFRLLTETPLKPEGAWQTVTLDGRLPRSLDTVQFLRVVPLSERGAETEFAGCPLVPIAVPSDRLPPAPRLEVQINRALGIAAVRVIAQGIDLVALKSAEPGLFGGLPGDASQPPRFRLRRSSGPIADPLYARAPDDGEGALDFDGTRFVADYESAALSPYVLYHYWAQIRLPPERRLPPGVLELPLPAGALLPTQPHQSLDAPGEYSALSAPAPVMFVPLEVASLGPENIAATVTADGAAAHVVSLTITGGPRLHPRAVAGYAVRIQIQRGDKPAIVEPQDVPLEDGALVWSKSDPTPPALSTRLVLALVDPLGTVGSPLLLDVETS